ncbi:cytochrome P450, partial [Umbelopsis sp. AD052]
MSTLLNRLQELVAGSTVPYLSFNRDIVDKVGRTTGLLVATYVVTTRVYSAFFGPLSKYPGPFLAKLFDWGDGYYDSPAGTRYLKLMDLHKKYGHIVRIAQNKLSISDKDMIQQILVTDDLPKGHNYEAYQIDGHPTMFDTTDKTFHKSRRRIVSPAFSLRYIGTMEPLMRTATANLDGVITKSINEANAEGREYAEVDLWMMLQHFAMDIIGLAAFGTEFNMVTTGHHPLTTIISNRLKFTSFIGLHPKISRWIPKSQDPYLVNFMKDVIQRRIDSGEKRQDILDYLIGTLNTKSEDDRLKIDDIINEVVLFLIAGSETTSNTMGFLFMEMLNNPHVYEKLRNEIDAIEMEEGQTMLQNNEVKALPYLNAVIEEALRLHPANPGGALRRTVNDITLVGKHHIPKNTTVIAMSMATQTHPDYWEEADRFMPERWLDPAEAKENAMAWFPFSAG